MVGTIISSSILTEIAFKLKSNEVVPEFKATEYFVLYNLIFFFQIH